MGWHWHSQLLFLLGLNAVVNRVGPHSMGSLLPFSMDLLRDDLEGRLPATAQCSDAIILWCCFAFISTLFLGQRSAIRPKGRSSGSVIVNRARYNFTRSWAGRWINTGAGLAALTRIWLLDWGIGAKRVTATV